MASVMPEKVIQFVPLCSSLELSSVAKGAYQRLTVGVKSACNTYDVLFQEPVYAVEHSCKYITERVDTDFFDPPYNRRQTQSQATHSMTGLFSTI